jgi:hypothetical protein
VNGFMVQGLPGRDHERARELAAARPDGFLTADETAWLDAHLEACDACAAVAAEYAGQSSLFAPARTAFAEPPRDLWARTSAAIEAEGRGRRGGARRFGMGLVYAPLAASLVVAVAVGAGLLNGFPATDPSSTGEEPDATPFPMEAGDVTVLSRNESGNLELRRQRIAQVCPTDAASCGVDLVPELVETELLSAAADWDAIISPDEQQVVVVERGEGAQGVYVLNVTEQTPVDVPTEAPSTAAPSPDAPTDAPATIAVTAPPSGDPAASPSPAATEPGATPSPDVPVTPSDEPAASPGGDATGAPATEDPSASPLDTIGGDTPDPSASPSVTAEPTAEPTPEPPPPTAEPTPSVGVTPLPNGALEIASDVEIVGTTAAYSPDGDHFAFTARPSDGSAGPDVFVWTVGDPRAEAVTDDGASLFAGWLARDLLVSRVVDGAARTVLLSLGTGEATPAHDDGMWRPTIGPGATTAAWWDGTVTPTDDAAGWRLDDGRLVLGRWPATGDDPVQVLADRSISDWQVAWDEDMAYVAVWTSTGTPDEPGTLSLYRVNPDTGLADLSSPRLDDAPAFGGFSLSTGRLIWSAPAGDGDRTVQVLAWKGDTFGRFEILSDGTTTVVR